MRGERGRRRAARAVPPPVAHKPRCLYLSTVRRALRQLLKLQPSNCGLVITEPYFNLPAMREALLQVGGRAQEIS